MVGERKTDHSSLITLAVSSESWDEVGRAIEAEGIDPNKWVTEALKMRLLVSRSTEAFLNLEYSDGNKRKVKIK